MKEKVVLINPPLVSCKGDFSGSGIPYMPILLASINALLKDKFDVKVYDMFGEAPNEITKSGCNLIHGKSLESVMAYGGPDVVAIVYAGTALSLDPVLTIVSVLKNVNTKRIIVVENSQHVTALPLDIYADRLIYAGANFVICGDPEPEIINAINGNTIKSCRYFSSGGEFPIPDWTGFPIENYWDLPYAHAPKSGRKYMQLLTSRGCPNVCKFCTSPRLNGSIWRPRTVESVFTEICTWCGNGVYEFHIEDLNPTVDKERIISLCHLIIDAGMILNIKIAAGTKIETLDEETLLWMYRAGFSYISFSPESGSTRVLQAMNKKFDHDYAVRMLKYINSEKFKRPIFTQACFIAGYPEENDDSIKITLDYIKTLAYNGLNEVAIFGFVPMPGSSDSKKSLIPTKKITFGSGWRMSKRGVEYDRLRMAAHFYYWQAIFHPGNLIKFFDSKVWMTLKRVLYSRYKALWAKTTNI